MKVQVCLTNDLGEFKGQVMNVSPEQFETIKTLSKSFYETGFEMDSEDGGFIIFPPDIVKKSILKINITSDGEVESSWKNHYLCWLSRA